MRNVKEFIKLYFEFMELLGMLIIKIFSNKKYEEILNNKLNEMFALENTLLQRTTIIYGREPYPSEMCDILKSIKDQSPSPMPDEWDSIIKGHKQTRN